MMREPDGVGDGQFDACGDRARFFLRAPMDVVVEARFQAWGCGPTIAAASAASEVVAGRRLTDVATLESDDVERALDGLPEDRKHAADVVVDALRAAARACLERQEMSPMDEGGRDVRRHQS